ncbi:Lysine histidine transporter-like 8 [Abeliophyllum distichum]|uniref:Lysine histidine transporter-like 8 n=1 Tax=Abeliophyllum distichum TaxID=126358 RepID=A0ABD1RQ90_9LAMI
MWLLINLHESPSGFRYSRYLHISIVAFGGKMGKMVAIFPTMYLSGGTCVLYIITGGKTLEYFYQVICGDDFECNSRSLRGTEWFLVFICLAILVARFFPNLDSLSHISLIGSITAAAYCSLIWILSILTKGRLNPEGPWEAKISDLDRICNALNGLGIIALAFRGHNVVLEIQGTMPTNRKHPSRERMWRGVIISYLLIAMCLYPLAIVGYWTYGNMASAINIEHSLKLFSSQMPVNGGILVPFHKFHQSNTSKYIVGTIYLAMVINCLCAFQVYAMPVFDNLERLYTSTKNQPCPGWLRSGIRIFFGGLAYCIAMAFPFLASLGAFMGAIALPLSLAYPCFMWITMKKPCQFSKLWCLNIGLGSLGMVLSILLVAASLRSLVTNGLDANFFNPI